MAIFTHSSLLVIGFVEGMELGERVDGSNYMVKHGLVIQAFTSLAGCCFSKSYMVLV